MTVFEEYIRYNTRPSQLMEEIFIADNEIKRLQTLYEMTNLQLSQMHRDAELKVITESGTHDDLVYLISEADNEAGQEKKGIIQRIFDAILKVINSIGSAISGIFKKSKDVPNNAKIPVDKDLYNSAKDIGSITSTLADGIDLMHAGDYKGAISKFANIAIPTAAAGGALLYITKQDGDTFTDKLHTAWGKITQGANKAKEKASNETDQEKINDANQATSKLNSVISFLGKVVNNVTSGINKVLGNSNDQNNNNNQPQATVSKVDNEQTGRQMYKNGAQQVGAGKIHGKDTNFRVLADGRIEKIIILPNGKEQVIDVKIDQIRNDKEINNGVKKNIEKLYRKTIGRNATEQNAIKNKNKPYEKIYQRYGANNPDVTINTNKGKIVISRRTGDIKVTGKDGVTRIVKTPKEANKLLGPGAMYNYRNFIATHKEIMKNVSKINRDIERKNNQLNSGTSKSDVNLRNGVSGSHNKNVNEWTDIIEDEFAKIFIESGFDVIIDDDDFVLEFEYDDEIIGISNDLLTEGYMLTEEEDGYLISEL